MIINQGEIWMVSFEPSIGSEIQKLRPTIVVNDNSIGRFGLRTVVLITEWKDYYKNYPWIIKIIDSEQNGLKKYLLLNVFK